MLSSACVCPLLIVFSLVDLANQFFVTVVKSLAARPRFEHGSLPPQGKRISNYPNRPWVIRPESICDISATQLFFTRIHETCLLGLFMATYLSRRVDFPMVDMANVAYYPRIYDLAHRFFEEAWEDICGLSYPTLVNDLRIGFPVVDISTKFHAPLRYGDTIHAKIWISQVGNKSATWEYEFRNQDDLLLWESTQVTVCVSMETMDSLEIPEVLKSGMTDSNQG